MVKRLFWPALIVALLIVTLVTGIYAEAITISREVGWLFDLRLPWQADVQLTATPTKTPAAPPTPTATATSLSPSPTPAPSAIPTALPPAVEPTALLLTSTPLPLLSEKLIRVVQEYGLDITGRFVVVDQNLQRMHVVESGAEVRTLPVSTGDPNNDFRTLVWSGVIGEYWGSFNAHGVWGDNAWYLFKDEGNILIHSVPYIVRDGIKVYQELDAVGRYPASRGCIRLLPEDAQWFTDWQPQGVSIVILPLDGGTDRHG